MNRYQLLGIALLCSACFGTEGSNPSGSSVCESLIYPVGVGPSAVTLPANARGLPISFTEWEEEVLNDPRSGPNTWELTVLRDGVESSDWSLRTPGGALIDTGEIVRGIVELVFEGGFVEGEHIVIRRDVHCLTRGVDHEISTLVQADVGPAAPFPTSAGVLSVDESTHQISLLTPAELTPWAAFVIGPRLQVDQMEYGVGHSIGSFERNVFAYGITVEGCQTCDTLAPAPDDGPPQVCHTRHWAMGHHSLLATLTVYGMGDISSEPLTYEFDDAFCAH